jgi:ArsR family transcriptional regulator, arsenate/arsenite/antimonite-responsive transcriptional repressor
MSKYRTKKIEKKARIFKALSNVNRLLIFRRLCSCCDVGTHCKGSGSQVKCVSDLGADLGIAASTLSHHMKELKNAGLIQTARNGQNIECWVEPKVLKEIAEFFSDFIK